MLKINETYLLLNIDTYRHIRQSYMHRTQTQREGSACIHLHNQNMGHTWILAHRTHTCNHMYTQSWIHVRWGTEEPSRDAVIILLIISWWLLSPVLLCTDLYRKLHFHVNAVSKSLSCLGLRDCDERGKDSRWWLRTYKFVSLSLNIRNDPHETPRSHHPSLCVTKLRFQLLRKLLIENYSPFPLIYTQLNV